MRIRIRYFATVREMIGLSEEEVTLPAGSTIGSLIELVRGSHESLLHLRNVLVTVNGKYTDMELALGEGDVVALFPPVSGG